MKKAVIFDMYETLITHYKSPLYFSKEMAQDGGVDVKEFQKMWHPTERDRSIGIVTTDNVIANILKKHHVFSKDKLTYIMEKRMLSKEECFSKLHPEILPMLARIKEKGYKLGLISNCFSEEAVAIRQSILFPYFDAVCLSYEEGVQKPDKEIFDRCMDRLGVDSEECIYIGDGGSNELEAARELGMHPFQAFWYYGLSESQMIEQKQAFLQLNHPKEVVRLLEVDFAE